MNKDRKLAFVTSANIDGPSSRKVDRKTGRVAVGASSGDESAESGETWYVDPRIDQADQTSQSLYDHQQPRVFDRGHQVRREDPVWGNAAEAEAANADTFHFTNCCPQEFRFNEQKRFWAGIEDYVLDNARAEEARVSAFTGPVFAPTDPAYRDIRVPLQFYKVIARVEDGQLRATAFLADQSELLTALPERLGGEERFRRRRTRPRVPDDGCERRGDDRPRLRPTPRPRHQRLRGDRGPPAPPLRGRPSSRSDQPLGGLRFPARARSRSEAASTFPASSLSTDEFNWRLRWPPSSPASCPTAAHPRSGSGP